MAQPSNSQTANPTQPLESDKRRKYALSLLIVSLTCSLGVGATVVFLEKQKTFPKTDGHGKMEYLVVSYILLASEILSLIAIYRLRGLLHLIYFSP